VTAPVEPAAFLLVRSKTNAYEAAGWLRAQDRVRWAAATFGPQPVVAYATASSDLELVEFIEGVRENPAIAELDGRMCKPLPEDDGAAPLRTGTGQVAALLVNVDYRQETERQVTLNLRTIEGVRIARAMWGPADVVAVVEAPDHEALRNTICDQVKLMKGVVSTTTLYCYPDPD
jgi:uncharacterized protein with GYD domain